MVASPAAPWDPCYEKEDGWLLHRYVLATGNTVRFAARDVRKERTGVHANLSISLNWVTLAWSNFNIEKDEDRVRLVNSAYKHLDTAANALDMAEFPQQVFKHGLDLFCIGLWAEIIGESVGGWLSGDPNRLPAKRLLGDYVLEEAGTILYAPPGAGKSNTALAWAVCQAYGIDRIWPLTNAATPLYINLERSAASMAARLARINRALGLDADSALPFLNARGKTLSDIYEAAKKTIDQEGCNVIYYDSISRGGAGSLNADDVANRIMDMLNALAPTWVALAHSPRQDESHVFGSQMFDAAADVAVQLRSQVSSDGLSTGIGLEVTKANDIRKPPLRVHVLEWEEDGLRAIRRGRPGEFAELEAGERRSLDDLIGMLITERGSMSGTAIADQLGKNRTNVATFLSHSNRYEIKDRRGKEVLYGFRTA